MNAIPSAVFRADASVEIGTGHVMRCLTLADALSERGTECRFICRPHPGNLLELIKARGYEALALSTSYDVPNVADETRSPYTRWLGVSVGKDAAEAVAAVGRDRVDWLVVDHYALDASWESRLRACAAHVLVIDDLANRTHDCDILLNQNLGREPGSYAGLVPDGCRVLTGAQFALLRPEFASLRPRSLARRLQVPPERVLVSLGGVDKDNETGKVLEGLAASALPDNLCITVVMGPNAPWIAQVRNQAARMPWPTRVVVGVPHLAALMAECDLAIGAAGSTAWERCCLGVPTLTVVLAENQRAGAQALEAAGACFTLGEGVRLCQDIEAKLRQVSAPGVLERMRRASAKITDGAGTARVVQELDDVYT
jgi:UDP-2,4-diacetamido-2,4,6-trideoxy-beta-L-altropyranose hydrolase